MSDSRLLCRLGTQLTRKPSSLRKGRPWLKMPASARSSTASPEPNEFPRRAGKPVPAGKYDKNPISPSQSTFSFDNEEPAQAGVTFKPNTFDETQLSRKFDRVSPKDSAPVSTVKRDQQETNLSRRKSQFYSEVFAYREPNISTRNRIHQYSIITAEVKTNVIVCFLEVTMLISRHKPNHPWLHR